MKTSPSASQIHACRLLGCLFVLHLPIILGLAYFIGGSPFLWLAPGLALFLWPFVLALHPGRSILRLFVPTAIAAAILAHFAGAIPLLTRNPVKQWQAAYRLEHLLDSNPKVILYSIDADYRKPLTTKKGYRQLGPDEIIQPDDMYDNGDELFQIDETRVFVKAGQTVNSAGVENYGKSWQILRQDPNAPDATEAKIEETPAPSLADFDREPYKSPAVLGYAEITDRTEQRVLIKALANSARFNDGNAALCFNPRHGLFIEDGVSTLDILICFECQRVMSFSGNDCDLDFVVGLTPEPLFNETLKKHGLPVAQPRY